MPFLRLSPRVFGGKTGPGGDGLLGNICHVFHEDSSSLVRCFVRPVLLLARFWIFAVAQNKGPVVGTKPCFPFIDGMTTQSRGQIILLSLSSRLGVNAHHVRGEVDRVYIAGSHATSELAVQNVARFETS